jgi:hypothetical protein
VSSRLKFRSGRRSRRKHHCDFSRKQNYTAIIAKIRHIIAMRETIRIAANWAAIALAIAPMALGLCAGAVEHFLLPLLIPAPRSKGCR